MQNADKATSAAQRLGITHENITGASKYCLRGVSRIAPSVVKVGLAGVVLAGAYKAAEWHFQGDDAMETIEFLVSEHDDRLAEECLSNIPVDSSTLAQEIGVAPVPLEWSVVADMGTVDEVVSETPVTGGVAEVGSPEEETSGGAVVASEGPKVVDATKPLEARATRALIGARNRMTYARRVFDACKVKFGTPKNTEANYKAVWRYAATQMKEHGLRPSHQLKVLPLIVPKVFVPTLDELVGQKSVGVYSEMVNGRFAQQLSTWERWTRKCRRLFCLE